MAKIKFIPTQLPKVSKYARDRQRPSSAYFKLKESTVEVNVDDLEFSENDPRAEDMDWELVDEIYNNLQEGGYDEDGQLAAVVPNQFGKYNIIDHHHLIAALKKLKQQKWYVDVYEYTGIDEDYLWSAATDFGFVINNLKNPQKKTTMQSVVRAAGDRVKKYGYVYRPGTPVDEVHIGMWLRETKQHEVFSEGKLTQITNRILQPGKYAGKKIRNLSTDEVRETICVGTNNYYGSGLLNNGRYGYVVCTDNAKADAPKWWNQVLNAMDDGYIPVIQTYSKKDDPASIVKHHKDGFERMYEQFVKTTRIVSKFYDKVQLGTLSRKEFYDKIEYVAMGQIDGEYDPGENDFIERPVC
jgi:hypothetical protein